MKRVLLMVALACALVLAIAVPSTLAAVINDGSGASVLAATETASAPAQPSGLEAEADNHAVKLTWNPNTLDTDLWLYVLEYKLPSEQWHEITIPDAAATTYTVQGLINYERYQFRLKVQDTDLNWSEYSGMVFATPGDATLSDLAVGGTTVADFSPHTFIYAVPLPSGTTVVPTVTAIVSDPGATAVVTNPTALPGIATVVVTAKAAKQGPKVGMAQKTYTLYLMGCKVTFDTNGGKDVEPIYVLSGQPVGDLPVPNRDGSIFLGWYTDNNSFEQAVSEDTVITSSVTLYARYAAIGGVEQGAEDASVGEIDCEPGFPIEVQSTDVTMGGEAVKEALQLEVLDNTPFAGLSVAGGGGVFTVTATEGYTPGSSYKLTLLNKALSFAGQADYVRTYCFTIYKPEIMKLSIDPRVKLIPATDIALSGVQASGLSAPLAAVGSEAADIAATGTFTYNGSPLPSVGDVLAIYTGTPLDQRDPAGDYSDEPVAYVEVIAVDGTTVTYRTAEAQEVLFTPDMLPVDPADDVDGNPGNHALTVAVSDMTYTGAEFAAMGLDADTVVEAGDYLVFYTGSFGDQAALVRYGLVDSVQVSGVYYVITYADVTEEQLQAAMDLYLSRDESYDEAVESLDLAAMEADIEQQAIESGFVQAAADHLASMALKTEGFQKRLGEADLPVGSPLESAVEISDLSVSVDISTELQHFTGLEGLRCAVEVSFNIPFGEALNIHLTGTFVEEFRTTLKASGGAVWKKKWIFPYIADYRLNAYIDLYNFTGIDIGATITTGGGGEPFDIAEEIKGMLGSGDYEDEEIAAETQAFYELYNQMLENEHDYVQVFSKPIVKKDFNIAYGILVGRFSVDFVVNADANLSLGLHFDYEKATRYVFSLMLFARTATSDQLDLVDENYTFQFYVMGTLGLRTGIVLRLELGLVSIDKGSIGLEVEVGPYIRVWGYFFYELKYANQQQTSKASGALYGEVGIYLEIRFLAQANEGEYAFNPTLYEHEWPLWHFGSRQNVFDFSYALTDATDDIYFKGTNTTYELPPSVFSMRQLDLKEGGVTNYLYPDTSFTIAGFTNTSFSQQDGVVTVSPPAGQHLVEGEMTVYWDGGPLSFTTVPIARTYHLVWDDLADSYMIAFNSQGGSLVSAVVGTYQSPVALPAPTRPGYTFGGWYDNAESLGEAYTATAMPAMNLQLYAKWTANLNTPYTVRHYLQTVAGSAYDLVATDTGMFTGATDTEATPAVNAYAGFTAPGTKTAVIKGDGSTVVEYYYSRNSYQLTFKPRNGAPDIVKTLVYGAETSAPQLTWSSYVFDGWFSDEGLSNPYTLTTMPAEHLTLYAGWTPTSITAQISHQLSSGVGGTSRPRTA